MVPGQIAAGTRREPPGNADKNKTNGRGTERLDAAGLFWTFTMSNSKV
jgi:hypothetical protein